MVGSYTDHHWRTKQSAEVLEPCRQMVSMSGVYQGGVFKKNEELLSVMFWGHSMCLVVRMEHVTETGRLVKQSAVGKVDVPGQIVVHACPSEEGLAVRGCRLVLCREVG